MTSLTFDELLCTEINRWAEATTKMQGNRKARLNEKIEAVVGFFSVAKQSPAEIKPPDIRIWCDVLEVKGCNASSIRDYVGFLSSFFEWLVKNRIPGLSVSHNPMKVIRREPIKEATSEDWAERAEALIKRTLSLRVNDSLNLRDFSTDDPDELDALIQYQRRQLSVLEDTAEKAACEQLIANMEELAIRLRMRRIIHMVVAMRAIHAINRKRGERGSWNMIIDEIRTACPSWNIPAGEDFTVQWVDKLEALLIDSLKQRLTHVPRTRLASAPIARSGYLRFPSERIFKATVESLMPGVLLNGSFLSDASQRYLGQAKQITDHFRVAHVFRSDKGDFKGAIGFTHSTDKACLQTIQNRPSLAVKMIFALWARLYAELSNPTYGQSITISVSQFCDDLGYKRKGGAHEPENRHQAILMLKAIFELEALILYKPNEHQIHMLGSIFQQFPLSSDIKGYSDVFVSPQQAEHESLKGARAFTYGPGKIYENPVWRARNSSVALANEGLLTLGNGNKDKWAVLIGGYLASFARMNNYQQQVLDTKTILDKTGLSGEKEKHRKLGRMHDKLETALDRLKEAGFIKSWQPIINESTQWLSEKIEICWPDTLNQSAIRQGRKRNKRPSRRK